MRYNFKGKFKDRVSGDQGFLYDTLEDETRSKAHDVLINFSYSTVPLFMEKKFAIPLTADVGYRYRFAGADNPTAPLIL